MTFAVVCLIMSLMNEEWDEFYMSCLVNFTPTGKRCKWKGCKRQAVRTKMDVKGKTVHCLRHQMMKQSGRVGANYVRDSYREHMKSECNMDKTATWYATYKKMVVVFKECGWELNKVDLVRMTSKQFEVDHISGNSNNNRRNNLQTLSVGMHKVKSMQNGDLNPARY